MLSKVIETFRRAYLALPLLTRPLRDYLTGYTCLISAAKVKAVMMTLTTKTTIAMMKLWKIIPANGSRDRCSGSC